MSNKDNTPETTYINLGDADSSVDISTNMADDIVITCGDLDSGYYSTDTVGPLGDLTVNNFPFRITTMDIDPVISIGEHQLTEQRLEKLNALLDILTDDPTWAEKINTQIAFNKLRGNK